MLRSARLQAQINLVEISSPCSVPWETMPGDDRVRFCGQCRQSVYNIAGLTTIEAQHLVMNREGRLCARILRRPDGTVVTADCWSRLRAARRKGMVQFVAVLLLVVIPELVAMRFGLANLMQLTKRGSSPSAASAIQLPPPPPLPTEAAMLGEMAPSASPERQVEDDVVLSLGLVWPTRQP